MKEFWPGFNTEQIAVLDEAFETVCKEFEVESSDHKTRERIVQAILKLARAGDFDLDHLLNYAISRLALRNDPD
jgi:hypothetical protein